MSNHPHYRNAVWATLNVILPVGASVGTYFIAMLMDENATRDRLIVHAFAGGDNFLVAAILYAIVMFEVLDAQSASQRAKLLQLLCFVFFALMLASYVGAKFYSFSSGKVELRQYYIGVTSLAAVGFSASIALAAKVFLLDLQPRKV